MVERIIDTFNQVLPEQLDEGVFVLGPDFGSDVRDQLTAICERHGMKAHFKVQDVPQGTGHAVWCAGEHLEGEGISVFADTLFNFEGGADLAGADVVAWVKHVEDPSRFGVAVREADRIVAFVEKPQELISNEALIGIYYVRELADLRRAIQYLMDNDIRGHGEIQLTDAFDVMLKEGQVFKTANVADWLDCGTIPALLETTHFILDQENDEARQGEVTNSIIHEPVYLGPGARVVNSVVGPHVSVEAEAEIEGSVVRESILFAHARVANAVLSGSLVGQHARVEGSPRRLNVGDHSEVAG
jgi:glucose-1-phosphate thymidylyltransferase